MIVQVENCQLEVGLVYEQTYEVIADGPLEGLVCRMEVRAWPKMGWIK